nr:39S ribosomal protein L54, mitochondrial isoform X1 [Oryctolagus cuniculus]
MGSAQAPAEEVWPGRQRRGPCAGAVRGAARSAGVGLLRERLDAVRRRHRQCVTAQAQYGGSAASSPPEVLGEARLRGVTKAGKGGAAGEALRDPEVCTDPERLCTHAMGVNIYKEGADVALRPDAEYPAWLFEMHLGAPWRLEELDPETRAYWRLLRKQNIWRHNRLSRRKTL